MPRMERAFPAQKVLAGGFAGACATVIIYVMNQYWLQEALPPEIAAASAVMITTVISYIVPPSRHDRIIIDQPTVGANVGGH